jgi:hypothetical protein
VPALSCLADEVGCWWRLLLAIVIAGPFILISDLLHDEQSAD